MRTVSLAARNLLRNGRRTALTTAAIAFGLALMMFNITLATGSYRNLLSSGISALAGHIVIEHPLYADQGELNQVVTGTQARIEALKPLLDAATITPRVQLGGLFNSPTNSVGVGLRGVVPSAEGAVLDLPGKMVEGEWLADDDDRGAILGVGLAEQLGVGVGDKIVFMGQGVNDEVQSRLFRVRGTFRTGSPEQDGFMAFATVAATQEILGVSDAVHQLAVHLEDPSQTHRVRDGIPEQADIVVKTWEEALPSLVGMIKADRTSNDFLMAVIGMIVAMGVLNTVLMSVLERNKEFGVLMAIGMRPRKLSALVLTEGLLLGILGTTIGLLVGCLISWPLVTHGLDLREMVGETFTTEGVVVSTLIKGAWNPARMAQYAVVSVVLTVLSALYPAWYISRQTPVDAMNRG